MENQYDYPEKVADTGFSILRQKGRQIHPQANKRLYSIKDAADYLALSTWTVRELIWNSILPHVRLGRRVLIDVQDLEALIRRNKISEP